MLADTKAYSGLAARDLSAALAFYRDVLGVRVTEEGDQLWLHLAGGRDTLVYEQPAATPASFTVLNFEVPDIEPAVDALIERGVRFEHYDGLVQDDKGIHRGEGPLIAWFKDPSGNVLAVLQEE